VIKLSLASVELATTICRFLGIGFRQKSEKLNILELESARILNLNQESLDQKIKKFQEMYQKERAVFN
jgi:hypothetical protein